MIFDPSKTDAMTFYGAMSGAIIPRPIAWVSSLSADGIPNLAPFSFYTVASVDPPIVCFNPMVNPDGRVKDTVNNILATREFTLNVVSEHVGSAMNATSSEVPPEVDEFKLGGLTPIPSERVKPARVKESLVHFECKLHEVISFGRQPFAGNLVLGEILLMHIDESVWENGIVERTKLKAIGRLGGPFYVKTDDAFEMIRPA